MSRSPLFTDIARALRLARFCNDQRLPTTEGLQRVREAEAEYVTARRSRHEWLQTVARAGAAALVTTPSDPWSPA